MKFASAYSLHHGDTAWEEREQSDWLTDLFEAPHLAIEPGCTGRIRNYLRDELTNAGWSYNVRIDPRLDVTVTGMSHDLAFQVQTGNISRAMYDLLKMQYLFEQKKIEAAALAVPTKQAADIIASNVSHVDRVWGELQFFDRIVTVPLLVVAFE